MMTDRRMARIASCALLCAASQLFAADPPAPKAPRVPTAPLRAVHTRPSQSIDRVQAASRSRAAAIRSSVAVTAMRTWREPAGP